MPANASFCGNCGRIQGDATLSVTGFTNISQSNLPPIAAPPNFAPPETPPLFNGLSYPPLADAPGGSHDVDETIKQQGSEEEEPNRLESDYIDRQSGAVW